MEFPVHPVQETDKRPMAALDRNLAYLRLVEVLYGYPIDGVVLTTGCDKTTPAQALASDNPVEPVTDVAHVAGLPLGANVQFMTAKTTTMPYAARG